MAVITRVNFTARGKLQNVIIQTYWNGKVVMRSKPLKYTKNLNQASQFNRSSTKSAILIASNWYVSFGQYYFNPPPPYERSQASFIGLLRKYAVESGQQSSYYDPVKLAESNFSWCNATPNKKLSCNLLNWAATLNNGIVNFNFQFLSPTNPNDSDLDMFGLGICCTNVSEPMQTLQEFADRIAGSAFGSLFIENYSPSKEYIIFAGFARPDGIENRNAFYSNFFGYFAIKNNNLFPVINRMLYHGIPF